MRKIICSIAAVLCCCSAAQADCCVISAGSNITSTAVGVVSSASGNTMPYVYVTNTCCVATVDEATLAAWAAKKAVESQLDWFDRGKVIKLNREDLDAMQERINKLCEWAKTLSNHILRTAYINWAQNANEVIAARRLTLDKLDVAKSLVTGLPTPPQ